jgi:hypothetical protein
MRLAIDRRHITPGVCTSARLGLGSWRSRRSCAAFLSIWGGMTAVPASGSAIASAFTGFRGHEGVAMAGKPEFLVAFVSLGLAGNSGDRFGCSGGGGL